MQNPKGDLLVPVITSLLVGALVSGSIMYAVTGMDKDDAQVAVATATPTATPSATTSATTTPTATPATTKDFTYNSKVLFSYPAEYTIIQQTSKYDGGGTLLKVEFATTNTTTGLVEKLPISISSLSYGAPTEAPSLESLLPEGTEDKKTFTNSKGTKALTAKYQDQGGFDYYGVVTEKNSGYKVIYGTAIGHPISKTYSEAKLKALFDQIMDTLSF